MLPVERVIGEEGLGASGGGASRLMSWPWGVIGTGVPSGFVR